MEVVDTARTVILAGGTMSPVRDPIIPLVPCLMAKSREDLGCGESAIFSSTQRESVEFLVRSYHPGSKFADPGRKQGPSW